jgi:hypothetical protein
MASDRSLAQDASHNAQEEKQQHYYYNCNLQNTA